MTRAEDDSRDWADGPGMENTHALHTKHISRLRMYVLPRGAVTCAHGDRGIIQLLSTNTTATDDGDFAEDVWGRDLDSTCDSGSPHP